jgi:quercetin dioxygenase-like cupin family protein
MILITHDAQPTEEWRKGVTTRMLVSAQTGSVQTILFEQWCEPGCGAPRHLHAVEEILTIFQGEAEVWIAGEKATLTRGQSVVIPAGLPHQFHNIGTTTLHAQAILASCVFEARYEDGSETGRRWLPMTDHALRAS